MLSIGEIIDKLVIELIKAHTTREKMRDATEDEYVDLNKKLNIFNTNRGIIKKELDDKIDRVNNGERNVILTHSRTY